MPCLSPQLQHSRQQTLVSASVALVASNLVLSHIHMQERTCLHLIPNAACSHTCNPTTPQPCSSSPCRRFSHVLGQKCSFCFGWPPAFCAVWDVTGTKTRSQTCLGLLGAVSSLVCSAWCKSRKMTCSCSVSADIPPVKWLHRLYPNEWLRCLLHSNSRQLFTQHVTLLNPVLRLKAKHQEPTQVFGSQTKEGIPISDREKKR